MQNTKNKAFTLVELLVVITILAIISVVAYQNFGGAVDKAVSGRKISDVATIETALQQYKADNNVFPKVLEYGSNNVWGYSNEIAQPSNTLRVVYSGQEILSLTGATNKGGGKVFGTGTLGSTQIGSKGTIGQEVLGKKYLTKDLYDPELGDIKVGDGKMIDYGIGRYVYAIYKKGSSNTSGNDFNIAFTIKKDQSDLYITKISGTYDRESCYLSEGDENDCPDSLIGTASGAVNITLLDGQEQILSGGVINTNAVNQGIPYPVTDFAQ